ncbi:MAG: hypothetical protein ACU0CY_01655 [Maritimibacter harenae]
MAPRRFSWTPGAHAGAETLTLDGTRLSGTDWTLDLAEISDAAFVNRVSRGNRMVRLELHSGEARHSIGYNGARRGYANDPDARTHLTACAAILRTLAAVRPGHKVALGVVRGGRWGMFLVGLGALVAGLVLAVAALAADLSAERLVGAAIPTLFLLLLGALITYGNWPCRARPRVAPGALAYTLDGMLAGNAPAA